MKNILFAAVLATFVSLVPRARAVDAFAGNVLDRGAAAGREWKDKLGLSPDQLAKFLPALKAKDADLQPLRDQLRVVARKLRSQLSEKAPEDGVQDSLRTIARLRKAVAIRNDQFDASLESFLAPSQRAKLLVWDSLGAACGVSALDMEAGEPHEPAVGVEAEEEPE